MKRFRARRATKAAVAALGVLATVAVATGARSGPVRADRDARRRPFVRDQDRRSAARLRADCRDRRPWHLRHLLHVQGRRPRPPAAAAGAVVDGVQGREDVRLQPAEERALRRRDAAHRGRRRLLVQTAHQPQGQPVLPARRSHGVVAREVHGHPEVEDPERGAAVDPDEHVARDRELEARAEARRHGRAGCRQERQGRAMAELRGLPRRGQRPVPACSATARRRRSRSSRTRGTGGRTRRSSRRSSCGT